MFRRRQRTGAVIGAGLMALIVSACGSSAGSSSASGSGTSGGKTTTITVAFSSADPGAEHADFFAGMANGIFSKNGITVKEVDTSGSLAASGLVSSGKADVALGGAEGLPALALKNANMVSVYQIASSPIFGVLFPSTSKAQTVADLKGASVGVTSAASGAVPILQDMLSANHLSMSDVTVNTVGADATAVAAIKQKRIDAMAGWDTMVPQFEATGLQLKFEQSSSLAGKYPGQVIYTTRSWAKSHADVLKKFLQSVTKSEQAGFAHPDATVSTYLKFKKNTAPTKSVALAQWKARSEIMKPANGTKYGMSSDAAWQTLISIEMKSGVIKSAPNVSNLYTNDYLPS